MLGVDDFQGPIVRVGDRDDGDVPSRHDESNAVFPIFKHDDLAGFVYPDAGRYLGEGVAKYNPDRRPVFGDVVAAGGFRRRPNRGQIDVVDEVGVEIEGEARAGGGHGDPDVAVGHNEGEIGLPLDLDGLMLNDF